MGPMDDLFFNRMGEDKGAIAEVISTIIGIRVAVEEVIPQYSITSLENRSVRLDSFSEVRPEIIIQGHFEEASQFGPKGTSVDIEVQKDDNDEHAYRVYYNGAAMILNKSRKSSKFAELPRAIVIFISAFDVFGEGRMIYHPWLTTKESQNITIHRPVAEYYVNTRIIETGTPQKERIAKLMKLFADPDTYDYDEFPNFSKRKNLLRNSEEEVFSMSQELQEFVDIEKKSQEQKTTLEHLKDIMESLQCTVDRAMEIIKIPQDQRSMYAGLIKKG